MFGQNEVIKAATRRESTCICISESAELLYITKRDFL